MKMAESQLIETEKELNVLEKERRDLAEFLCEDASTFKLEECFRVFHGFCQKFRQALEVINDINAYAYAFPSCLNK